MLSLLASQLFMFGNDWADSHNDGMLGNKVPALALLGAACCRPTGILLSPSANRHFPFPETFA